MTVNGWELYRRVTRRIGGRTGTIGTVTVGGSTTTLVLNGLKGTTLDDTAYAADILIFPDSAAGSQEAPIITWVDASGLATIPNQSDPPVLGETYILTNREDYRLAEYQSALQKTLLYTPRTYRQIVPFTPYLKLYPLSMCDWLTGDGDIDAVFTTTSPLMLHNEDMSLWQNGTSSAPDGYTLTGAGATIARASTGIRSNYAATVTAGGGALCRFTQDIPGSLVQWLTRRTFPIFIPMRASAWLTTTDADSVRVFIYDGTTYHYSDAASATGVPAFPNLSVTPDGSMTAFTWGVEIAASKSATISFAGLMQNTLDFNGAYQLKDAGSQFYDEAPAEFAIRNIGGIPYIELSEYPAMWGQLVAYVRRPFPAYTADTDTFDDQYARVLEAGLVRWLLDSVKPGQDRGRLDVIMKEDAARWTRAINNVVDLPVPMPPQRQEVRGW